MRRRRRWRFGGLLGAVALLAQAGAASQLQLPHVGGRDGALSGNVVASPQDGPSILYFNPAGVVGQEGTQLTTGMQLVNARGRYEQPALGYREATDEFPFAPTLWVGTDHFAPWYVGIGLYGAVGSAFDFPADPGAGVPSQFLGELGVLHLGMVAGRELAPGLRWGIQVAPSFGSIRGRTPSPLGNVRFDIDGFGVVGSTGLLYDWTDRVTLGLSYRSPGIVFMRGRGRVGGTPDRVQIDFRTPQNVTFGVASRVTDRLLVTAQVNWAYYPDFERGRYEFDKNPVLDQKFIDEARPVFRYGVGIEYALSEHVWLRCGFSYEPWMIEKSAVRPTLYDTTDLMFMAGVGFERGRWKLDVVTGVVDLQDRNVTPSDQLAFPGEYEMSSPWGFGVMATYRFAGR